MLERALAIEGRAPVDDLRQGRLDPAGRAAVGAAAVRLRDAPLLLRPLLGASFDEISRLARSGARADAGGGGLAPARARHLAHCPSWTSGSCSPSARSRHWRWSGTSRCWRLPSLPAPQARTAPTRGRRWTTSARSARSSSSADVVLGIYREEMYRPGQGVEGATELILAKNRNGPTGFVDLFFYPRILRFEDMLDPACTARRAQDAGLRRQAIALLLLRGTTAPDSSTSEPFPPASFWIRTQSGGPFRWAKSTVAPSASLASFTSRQPALLEHAAVVRRHVLRARARVDRDLERVGPRRSGRRSVASRRQGEVGQRLVDLGGLGGPVGAGGERCAED